MGMNYLFHAHLCFFLLSKLRCTVDSAVTNAVFWKLFFDSRLTWADSVIYASWFFIYDFNHIAWAKTLAIHHLVSGKTHLYAFVYFSLRIVNPVKLLNDFIGKLYSFL